MWTPGTPQNIVQNYSVDRPHWYVWLSVAFWLLGMIGVLLALRGRRFQARSGRLAAHLLSFGTFGLLVIKMWPFGDTNTVAYLLATDACLLSFALLCAEQRSSAAFARSRSASAVLGLLLFVAFLGIETLVWLAVPGWSSHMLANVALLAGSAIFLSALVARLGLGIRFVFGTYGVAPLTGQAGNPGSEGMRSEQW